MYQWIDAFRYRPLAARNMMRQEGMYSKNGYFIMNFAPVILAAAALVAAAKVCARVSSIPQPAGANGHGRAGVGAGLVDFVAAHLQLQLCTLAGLFCRRCKRLPLPVPAAATAAAAVVAATTSAAGKCWCLPHPPLLTTHSQRNALGVSSPGCL
jgi:hypothetical protein